MNPQQIATALVMERLDLPLKMDSFEDRLVLQKAIYLAQAKGVRLGYYFGWYLRGPYCPALASNGFDIVAERRLEEDPLKGWKLDEESVNRLRELAPLVQQSDQKDRPRWLELLASVHFLIERGRVECSPKRIASVLRSHGKDFSEKEVERAIQELRKHGLIQGQGCN